MQTAKPLNVSAHGAEFPAIGFGTLDLAEKAAPLVAQAIRDGYRHIDTARKYGSEEGVGEGIRASGIPRSEIWVTTKVTEDNAREKDFMNSVETSLKAMRLDYIDLLLIHWPQPKVPLAETVGALVKAKRQGLARHVGVSNFTLALLDEAVRLSPEPLVTNQLEFHAYLPQQKLYEACRRYGMVLTAYSPTARGELLKDPVVNEIARAKGRTPAQIALRYVIQHPGIAAVPRAFESAHAAENINVFDFSLTEEEMARLRALNARRLRVVNPPERAPVWDEP
ncbi:MAG TPA: aldo/keto reductase [Xanthobacteraceae bacterium]|nr:aldo/keto reductase [Xanthobacteraceae bacterium]